MSEIFTSVLSGTFDIGTYLLCTATALACGILAALTASYRSRASKSFLVCLTLLPVIVETVIIMVNGNIGTGVAVMGAFSLVRFRSVPGKAKDIASIFLAMTAGLACAAGYVAISLIFTVLVCAVMLVMMRFPTSHDRTAELRITVPESLHFMNAFDDIFAEYTNEHKLVSVKTSNMGSLYKLLYRIELKNETQAKEMIDALRCRNGNLEISLGEPTEKSEEL
ncbi:MAG: DUF4956 domain-containing protein [Clostridia bacterium]|nr:DUF4956 domain-containing protein [Clostridia bacterium]